MCVSSIDPHLFQFTHSGGYSVHVLERKIIELNINQNTGGIIKAILFLQIIKTLPKVFYKAKQSKIPKLLLKYILL